MTRIYIILLSILMAACGNSERNIQIVSELKNELENPVKKSDLASQQHLCLNPDSAMVEYVVPPMAYFDSLIQARIDTTTMIGKREQIMREFIRLNYPNGPYYDTLFDLNYDGFLDYVIGFYYQTGSGLKNGIEVHLFDPKNDDYQEDSLLSSIANPSFYLKEKLITGFYLPNGAGGGQRLEWIRGEWLVTKEVSGSSTINYLDAIYWRIYYPISKKKDSVLDYYRGVPRQDILRNEYGGF